MPIGVYGGSKAHAIDDEPCAINNKVTNNMRPKGKLFALLAIFAAIGLVTATGAFTSVQAQRTISVDVTGDSAALLQLQPAPNQNYASLDNNGELTIDFRADNLESQGINVNATTIVVDLFNATNNGGQNVNLNYTISGDNADSILLINSSSSNAGNWQNHVASPQNNGNSILLNTGSTYAFGIVIDTTDNNGDFISNETSFQTTITFNATAA